VSLGLIAAQSGQYDSYARVVQAMAMMYERLPTGLQVQAADRLPDLLAGLRQLILTDEVTGALMDMAGVLEKAGRGDLAKAIREAKGKTREVGG
jgi:hypothetical protein